MPPTVCWQWMAIWISSRASDLHACIDSRSVRSQWSSRVCRAPYESPAVAKHTACLSLYAGQLPTGLPPPSLRHNGSRDTASLKNPHENISTPTLGIIPGIGTWGISMQSASKPSTLDTSSERVGRPDIGSRPLCKGEAASPRRVMMRVMFAKVYNWGSNGLNCYAYHVSKEDKRKA